MIKIVTNNIIVRIYTTKLGMRKALKRIGFNGNNSESMVIPVTIYKFYSNGKKKKLSLCGEMWMHKNISMTVLVHEALHAATTILRRNKIKPDLSCKIGFNEEVLAYTQTAILQDIFKKFFPCKKSDYIFNGFDDIKEWAKLSCGIKVK